MWTISRVLVLIFMSILDGGIIKHQILSQIHYCGIKHEIVNKQANDKSQIKGVNLMRNAQKDNYFNFVLFNLTSKLYYYFSV